MGAIVCFVLAAICLILSILQFMGKGICLNNAYIYASAEERETMDKRPYYRQSAIVFALLFCSLACDGLYAKFQFNWMIIIAIALLVITIVYAIVSSIRGSVSKK